MNSPKANCNLVVRPIEPRDACAINSLIAQLGYTQTAQQVLDWIAAANPSQQTAFVACLDGEIVGWIEVSVERHLQVVPFCRIGGLVVAEVQRGKGIGRELCRIAEEWSWQHTAERVRVTSRSTRLDAHRFYARDGYEIVKTSLVFEKARPR
jgi:(aminoalkyl)phosphonate N-acetyltransferase